MKEGKGNLKARHKSKEARSLEESLEGMVEVSTKSFKSLNPVTELRRTVSRKQDNRGMITDLRFKSARIVGRDTWGGVISWM